MSSAFRQWLIFVLRLIFGISVLGAVVLYGGVDEVPRALATVAPAWFWSAFFASLLSSIIIPAVITRYNLKIAGIAFTVWELVRINLGMRFYVLTLPHALTVGIRWLRYRGAQKNKGWEAAALIAFDRTLYLFVVVALAASFLILLRDEVPPSLRVLVPVSMLATAGAFTVLLLFVSSRAFGYSKPVLDRLINAAPASIAARVAKLAASVSAYQGIDRSHLLFVLLWSLLAHVLFITSGYLVSRGLGLGFGFYEIGWMRSVVYLTTLLPVTVGGLGVREAGFAALFMMHGVDRATAVAFPLVLVAIQMLLGLLGAGLEILRALEKRGRANDEIVQG